MKNLDYEKIFLTVACVFMFVFGFATSGNVNDFIGGCCTGAAAIITYACWKD